MKLFPRRLCLLSCIIITCNQFPPEILKFSSSCLVFIIQASKSDEGCMPKEVAKYDRLYFTGQYKNSVLLSLLIGRYRSTRQLANFQTHLSVHNYFRISQIERILVTRYSTICQNSFMTPIQSVEGTEHVDRMNS